MQVKFWGVRGSVPVANEQMMRYGGETSCVEVTLSDGTAVILDAGTGVRDLGAARTSRPRSVEMLLTHLHLDHIQGLLFFPPLFDPEAEVTVYGPSSVGPALEQRLGRYLSTPLSPLEIHELPAKVSFVACPFTEWELGPARIRAATVAHRGITVGYRITEGDTTLCYIPDHEPALGSGLESPELEWMSGSSLAYDATLLIHDAQYTVGEYEERLGWGHSALPDAVAFASRMRPRHLALFHHDPMHDDATLDGFLEQAREQWEERGHHADTLLLAQQGTMLDL